MQEGDACPCGSSILLPSCYTDTHRAQLLLIQVRYQGKKNPGKGCKTLAQGNCGVTIPGSL